MGSLGSARFTYNELADAASTRKSIHRVASPLFRGYRLSTRFKNWIMCVKARAQRAKTFVKVIPLRTIDKHTLAISIEVGNLIRTDMMSLADPVCTTCLMSSNNRLLYFFILIHSPDLRRRWWVCF